MKKLTILTLALAASLLLSGLAFAGNMDMSHGDMNHGEMKGGDMKGEGAMAPMEAMKSMESNLEMMKADVAAMKDPAKREAAMGSMNKHMMGMHHGMSAMESHAQSSGDAGMQKGMKELNMGMMETMKGMGMMKKDADAAMPMMNGGLDKMESTLDRMKGMM